MRGKKVDSEFVAEFISNCAMQKKLNPEDICKEAEIRIQKIDAQIREVEELKKLRSKLKDVIITLDKTVPDKSKDKNILAFYGISNLPLANNFCLYLKSCASLPVNSTSSIDASIVKQLFTIGVIKREANNMVPGEKFQDFLDFYSKTYKI